MCETMGVSLHKIVKEYQHFYHNSRGGYLKFAYIKFAYITSCIPVMFICQCPLNNFKFRIVIMD